MMNWLWTVCAAGLLSLTAHAETPTATRLATEAAATAQNMGLTDVPPAPPPAVHPAPSAVHVLRILSAGDSITDGLAATNSYRADLQALLAGKGIPVEYVGSRSNESNPASTLHHDGIPGLRVEELSDGNQYYSDRRNIFQWVQIYRPDLVLIMIGTNNIWFDSTVPPAQQKLREMLDRLTVEFPDVRFIVSNIPPLKRQDWDADARHYNEIFPILRREMPRPNLSFIDVYSRLTVEDLFDDGIHPNPAGMQKIAQAWAEAIESAGLR